MRRLRPQSLVFLLSWITLVFCTASVRAQSSELADPWMQPFSADSIWNMPIGREARLIPAGINCDAGIEPELEYIYRISNVPFARSVLAIPSWTQRLGGKEILDQIPIDDFILGADPNDLRFPNACAALLMPDRRSVKNVSAFSRSYRTGPVYAASVHTWDLLEGDGLDDGRPGSGMSILGGALVRDGLNSLQPIHHAIKLCLPSTQLHAGHDQPSYRWPATRARMQMNEELLGTNPALIMGSLLTLSDHRHQQLRDKLQTEFGRAMADTLYRFGAYVADRSVDQQVRLCMTPEFARQLRVTYDDSASKRRSQSSLPGVVVSDLNLLFSALDVVEDNTVDTVGGAGPRRVLTASKQDVSANDYCGVSNRIIPLKNGYVTDGELLPEFWFFARPSKELIALSVDTESYYSPPQSLRFHAIGTNQTASVAQLVFDTQSPLKLSARVRVRGEVRVQLVATKYLAHYKPAEEVTIATQELSVPLDAELVEHDWRMLSGRYELGPDAHHFRLEIRATGVGTLWLDDFEAIVIGESTHTDAP